MEAEEATRVERARQGDEAAMEALFNQHVNRSVHLAYIITCDWATAEDAAQEAFIRAFVSIRRLKPGTPFAPWFTAIVVNQARNYRRKANPSLPLDAAATIADQRPSPHEEAERAERKRRVAAALYSLDEKYRLPVVLKYVHEFSEAEVAHILKLPVSTVKSRLYTARERLKDLLREEDERNG
jgi:RNA polymerase sigma-70 factor (ECF subfamily)